MKLGASVILFMAFACLLTPAGQLVKFPFLVEHFNKHQSKEGISLIAFLKEHYSSQHNDNDTSEDEQLPFKRIEFFSFGNAVMPASFQTASYVPLPIDHNPVLSVCAVRHQDLSAVFHPPRLLS